MKILKKYFQKLVYPDYIHIDMVDKTMNKNVNELELKKILEIKKRWPNHRIESHIMSMYPLNILKNLENILMLYIFIMKLMKIRI